MLDLGCGLIRGDLVAWEICLMISEEVIRMAADMPPLVGQKTGTECLVNEWFQLEKYVVEDW